MPPLASPTLASGVWLSPAALSRPLLFAGLLSPRRLPLPPVRVYYGANDTATSCPVSDACWMLSIRRCNSAAVLKSGLAGGPGEDGLTKSMVHLANVIDRTFGHPLRSKPVFSQGCPGLPGRVPL